MLFNAECTVRDTTNFGWLNIDILVDGGVMPPSDGDNALCTSHNTNTLFNWVSAVTNVVRRVPGVGWHLIQVRAKGETGINAFRLDDTSTIVMR